LPWVLIEVFQVSVLQGLTEDVLPEARWEVQVQRGKRTNCETQQVTQELEELQVRRRIGARIRDVTITVLSMVVSRVDCLDKQGQDVWFQLLADVCKRVPERTSSIDTAFALEVCSIWSLICSIHSEAFKIAGLFDLLEDLAEQCALTLVIDLSRVSKVLSLSSLKLSLLLAAAWELVNYSLDKLILHAEQDHWFDIVEEFGHVPATSISTFKGYVRH
jgi:hypothetical protein